MKGSCQAANGGTQATHVVPVDVTASAGDLSAYVAAVRSLVGQVDYLILAAGEIFAAGDSISTGAGHSAHLAWDGSNRPPRACC